MMTATAPELAPFLEIGRLKEQLRQSQDLATRLQVKLSNLITAAEEVIDGLDGFVDIEDGSDGPRPNMAMRVTQDLDDAISHARRP